MSTRAYLLYAECVKMGHGKFAGQIYKKYKDTFPGFEQSMNQFGFYAWHDPAQDILEGVKYVREQMIADGSYQPPEAKVLLTKSEEAAKGYVMRDMDRSRIKDYQRCLELQDQYGRPEFMLKGRTGRTYYAFKKPSLFRRILLFFTPKAKK
jgi:hypothetical protein